MFRGLFLSPLLFCPLALYTSSSREAGSKFFCILRGRIRYAGWVNYPDFVMTELPIIQKTYDLIQWYVPILNRLPRNHKFTLGDRIITGLYDLLEGLIKARYSRDKLVQLQRLNTGLDILRYQTRLLLDFKVMDLERFEYVGRLILDIGNDLGGWIKSQAAN